MPTIDITGPMDENEQPPVGRFHKVVVPDRKKPELHVLNARVYNEKEALGQTLSISIQDVLKEVDKLIQDIASASI